MSTAKTKCTKRKNAMASGKPLLNIGLACHMTLSVPCVWLLIGAIRAAYFCIMHTRFY